MKKLGLLAILSGVTCLLPAQESLPRYWVSFTDKDNTPYSVNLPEEFLSSRSIDRRERQGIAITEDDLPVDPQYLYQIRSKGVPVLNISKWFNGALVELEDTSYLDTLRNLDFIKPEIIRVKPGLSANSEEKKFSKFKADIDFDPSIYGYSYNQISMLQGDFLHEQGYSGEGMLIAVLDAGFSNANVISSLQTAWEEDRVIAWKDFVHDTANIFNSHNHGTAVFSIMGGIQPGVLVGTAPNAEYALVRTEDGNSEYLVEEYNWICGAEFADSLGADVINSSLGYHNFNDSSQNYTYADMNGRTAPISIAATRAARKGIAVVTSAGNNGDDPWFRIGAPADADSILAVGAVDSTGIIARFSSRGPSYDGRIKPDVVAQGVYDIAQHPNGNFIYCSGTSCSSPVMAGLTASLWQAHPNSTNMEVINAIRRSASQYFNPDSVYGYGIPNMFKADWLLQMLEDTGSDSFITFSLFPNPATDYFYLGILRPGETNTEEVVMTVYDMSGQVWQQKVFDITGSQYIVEIEDISGLSTGIYILDILVSGHRYHLLLSKQ